jgi:uncharacterized ferritin-like protein (DUF455 family)
VSETLRSAALAILNTPSLEEKVALTSRLAASWRGGELELGSSLRIEAVSRPGRPPRPRLVAPAALPRRGAGTVEGRAARLHALAHIELNAVDLAWDAVCRFPGLPTGFYRDWVAVALEEAEHFSLLRGRLNDLGYDYGEFDAHDGLWEMAVKTAHDPLVRMALVPRVLEARALEAVPQMVAGLRQAGDGESVAILERIMVDEVGHVAAGSRWFRHLCGERGLASGEHWFQLLADYRLGRIKGPLNLEARRAAGFDEQELARLGQPLPPGGAG